MGEHQRRTRRIGQQDRKTKGPPEMMVTKRKGGGKNDRWPKKKTNKQPEWPKNGRRMARWSNGRVTRQWRPNKRWRPDRRTKRNEDRTTMNRQRNDGRMATVQRAAEARRLKYRPKSNRYGGQTAVGERPKCVTNAQKMAGRRRRYMAEAG